MKTVRISLASGRDGGLAVRSDPDTIAELAATSGWTERAEDGLIYTRWDMQHIGAWLEEWMRRGVRIVLDYEQLT